MNQFLRPRRHKTTRAHPKLKKRESPAIEPELEPLRSQETTSTSKKPFEIDIQRLAKLPEEQKITLPEQHDIRSKVLVKDLKNALDTLPSIKTSPISKKVVEIKNIQKK